MSSSADLTDTEPGFHPDASKAAIGWLNAATSRPSSRFSRTSSTRSCPQDTPTTTEHNPSTTPTAITARAGPGRDDHTTAAPANANTRHPDTNPTRENHSIRRYPTHSTPSTAAHTTSGSSHGRTDP
ncbi:hypothetical protein KGD82_14220 [Nocardiopsis eucommiae]|uniref:Uncharacterized protein n=1 Tax=Nocardiopsis eucommiae TaxID=2831970 RepID=A0A975L557_9ACTN|nr:hypothetical protein KGD82_14220 [Nocardiopsis eucommiae]